MFSHVRAVISRLPEYYPQLRNIVAGQRRQAFHPFTFGSPLRGLRRILLARHGQLLGREKVTHSGRNKPCMACNACMESSPADPSRNVTTDSIPDSRTLLTGRRGPVEGG